MHRFVLAASLSLFVGFSAQAQDYLPQDNGIATYHTAPRYRESESHPLRVLAYVVHPIGWVAREVFFRPLSYFASSTETTRSVMGYREPYDYRQPECFSADDSTPDCRSVAPFNYDASANGAGAGVGANAEVLGTEASLAETQPVRQVYFPDVNFDFNARKLNDLGKGRTRQIANLIKESPGLKVVLEGHTDYVGADSYNEKLGMDRAKAVNDELTALGVPADRVASVSFGKSQPILPEQEPWARAVNRRVSVHLE